MTIPNGMASTTICVDWDATVVPWDELEADNPPIDGAVEFIRKAKSMGFRVVILTSRLSPSWLIETYGERDLAVRYNEQRSIVARQCAKYGIIVDDITSEKVPARWYIDDRAIEFRDNWRDITERIL